LGEGYFIMLRYKGILAASVLGSAFALSGAAYAADLGRDRGDRKWESEESSADIWGRGWVVRARALYVVPDESSSNWRNAGDATRHRLSIDSSVVPEVDISYFFNRHIAAEVILGVTPHTIKAKGDLAETIATRGVIGDAWLLPATALLQYHFDPIAGAKPYIGAGVNYTVFFGADAGPNYDNLKLDNRFGWALQAGVDIPIGDRWFLNVDVKKIFLDTTAQVDVRGGNHVTVDAQIDPWVFGFGVGYRFGGAPAPLK
jgi:outer membrane protein